jgi:hypothetical protein
MYRVLLGVAAAILLATGVLHAMGLSMVAQTLSESGLDADWVPVFKGLWLMFSIHLFIGAALLVVLAVLPAGRLPLAVLVALPVADTILLLMTVGVFIGSIMTGSAAVVAIVALIAYPVDASNK